MDTITIKLVAIGTFQTFFAVNVAVQTITRARNT